jgi:hypothetical protein
LTAGRGETAAVWAEEVAWLDFRLGGGDSDGVDSWERFRFQKVNPDEYHHRFGSGSQREKQHSLWHESNNYTKDFTKLSSHLKACRDLQSHVHEYLLAQRTKLEIKKLNKLHWWLSLAFRVLSRVPAGCSIAQGLMTTNTCERKALHPAHMTPKWIHETWSKEDFDFRISESIYRFSQQFSAVAKQWAR